MNVFIAVKFLLRPNGSHVLGFVGVFSRTTASLFNVQFSHLNSSLEVRNKSN